MKRNNTESDYKKELLGKRLSEVMFLKGMDRTQIRKTLDSEYGYPINRQTYDKYQKGLNWMPAQFVENVSSILDIDSGYLLGDDNCFCNSYSEYVVRQELSAMGTGKERYIDLLSSMDFLVTKDSGSVIWTDGKEQKTEKISDPFYTITKIDSADDICSKSFTQEELYQFFDAISEYANKYFNKFKGSLDKKCMKEGDASD